MDLDTLNQSSEKIAIDTGLDLDKLSISSEDRLQEILVEAENELAAMQPEIDELEEKLRRLQELKQTKQKLITLKLSVQSILNNFSSLKLNISENETDEKSLVFNSNLRLNNFTEKPYGSLVEKRPPLQSPIKGTFYPDLAFEKAGEILKQKNSLNYELFRAIVFAGGRNSTQGIKQYLVEQNITLPASREGFETVPLTDISARVNYLIRKGLVASDGRGYFRATVGWEEVLPE